MSGPTLDITEARNQLNRIDERLRDEQVIYVTKRDKQVFAVVDLEFLETILETIEIVSDPDTYRMFIESIDDIRHGRVRDHEDVKRDLM